MKLSEDQIAQLLSSFWIQANLPDNLPSNFEAIAHSFILTLIVLRTKVGFVCVHIACFISIRISIFFFLNNTRCSFLMLLCSLERASTVD